MPEIEAGSTFGEWTVIETGHRMQLAKQRKSAALCRCSCGVQRLVLVVNLRDGYSQSCGTGIHDPLRDYKPEPCEANEIKPKPARKPRTRTVKPKPEPDLFKADTDKLYQGVYRLLNGQYTARVVIDGTRKTLGSFKTRQEAEDAYADAAISSVGSV